MNLSQLAMREAKRALRRRNCEPHDYQRVDERYTLGDREYLLKVCRRCGTRKPYGVGRKIR